MAQVTRPLVAHCAAQCVSFALRARFWSYLIASNCASKPLAASLASAVLVLWPAAEVRTARAQGPCARVCLIRSPEELRRPLLRAKSGALKVDEV